MKTFFLKVVLVLGIVATLQNGVIAQTPGWVSDLANTLGLDVQTVTEYSVVQNDVWVVGPETLYSISLRVKGVLTNGNSFIGKMPVRLSNGVYVLDQSFAVTKETCESQCGCNGCKFVTNGCECTGSTGQPGCDAWCKHTITKDQ